MPPQPYRYEHEGRRLTAAEWASELGIAPSTFEQRIRRKEPPERLFRRGKIRDPTPRPNAILLTHDGRTQSLSAWGRELGLTPVSFCRRRSRGWVGDRLFAGRQPPGQAAGRGRKYAYAGRAMTAAEWAEELGITVDSFYGRLSRGWPAERVFCRVERRGRLITHDGRTQTLSAWAEELGISMRTFSMRLANKLPTDRVFTKGNMRKGGAK